MTEIRVCQNPECGKALVQREGESTAQFTRRKTCHRKCSSKFAGAMKAKADAAKSALKMLAIKAMKPPCPACGKELVPLEGENPHRFARRKTCGDECGRNFAAATKSAATRLLMKAEERVCQVPTCDNVLEPREGERLYRFKQRKACSDKCQRILAGLGRQRTVVPPDRRCAFCDKVLIPKEGEFPRFFVKRKTCNDNDVCTRGLMSITRTTTAIVEDRRCLGCVQVMVRQEGEAASHFMSRVTCNDECLRLYQSSRRRLDFYGALLPPEVIAEILGMSVSRVVRAARRVEELAGKLPSKRYWSSPGRSQLAWSLRPSKRAKVNKSKGSVQ